MKTKLIFCTLFILVLLSACQKLENSIKKVSIDIQKYSQQTKEYQEFKQITAANEIDIFQQLIDSIEERPEVKELSVETPEYQFYFNYQTKNAEIKPVVYTLNTNAPWQIGTENKFFNLTETEIRDIQKILDVTE